MDDALKLLDELEAMLKDPERHASFLAARVNTSLALLAVDGLRAYCAGDHVQAAEDLAAAAEEILERHARRGPPS
jgi:hypothetical protein